MKHCLSHKNFARFCNTCATISRVAELLPCPFCTSSQLTLENLVDDDDWYVHCEDCGIQQLANYTQDEAISRWNRRAQITKTEMDTKEAWVRVRETDFREHDSKCSYRVTQGAVLCDCFILSDPECFSKDHPGCRDCLVDPLPDDIAPKALGNLIDRWDMMANDTKDYLREIEPSFCSAMDELVKTVLSK